MKYMPAATFIAVLSIACNSPTEPTVLVGTFVLQSFALDALPAVTFEDSVVRFSIVADTLVIAPGGVGLRRLTERSELVDGSHVPEDSQHDIPFTIARDSDRLVVTEHVACLDDATVVCPRQTFATLRGAAP